MRFNDEDSFIRVACVIPLVFNYKIVQPFSEILLKRLDAFNNVIKMYIHILLDRKAWNKMFNLCWFKIFFSLTSLFSYRSYYIAIYIFLIKVDVVINSSDVIVNDMID